MNFYTHAGRFHADEFMAYVILKANRICDRIVRLTDFTDLPADGIVGDIGQRHDLANRCYGHHQGQRIAAADTVATLRGVMQYSLDAYQGLSF